MSKKTEQELLAEAMQVQLVESHELVRVQICEDAENSISEASPGVNPLIRGRNSGGSVLKLYGLQDPEGHAARKVWKAARKMSPDKVAELKSAVAVRLKGAERDLASAENDWKAHDSYLQNALGKDWFGDPRTPDEAYRGHNELAKRHQAAHRRLHTMRAIHTGLTKAHNELTKGSSDDHHVAEGIGYSNEPTTLEEAKEVHQVFIDGKLESSHSSEEDAKKRIKQLAFDYKHRTKEPFMAGGKDKRPKIEIRKNLKESSLEEANKSSIGYSNEPKENEVWTHKAHGNRTLVMKGTKVGGMIGHIDHIPHVNLVDMSSDPSKDGHHAYGLKYRRGKHGIIHAVTHRLGEFASHEDALGAIKKFHKIKESNLSESQLDEAIIKQFPKNRHDHQERKRNTELYNLYHKTLSHAQSLSDRDLDARVKRHEEERHVAWHDNNPARNNPDGNIPNIENVHWKLQAYAYEQRRRKGIPHPALDSFTPEYVDAQLKDRY